MKKKLSEREVEEQFNDMLDDIYGDIKICGYSYNSSRALKELDPIAYREGFNNWIDSEESIFEDSNGDYWEGEDDEDDN